MLCFLFSTSLLHIPCISVCNLEFSCRLSRYCTSFIMKLSYQSHKYILVLNDDNHDNNDNNLNGNNYDNNGNNEINNYDNNNSNNNDDEE